MTVELNDATRELLDGAHHAVLATVNADGSPQTSVVWIGRDGDTLLIPTQEGRKKVRNLRRDPRVSVTVYDTADPDRYVEVRGTAALYEDVDREAIVRLAVLYEGESAAQEYRELPPEVVRLVVRITPRRVVGTAAS